MAQDHSELDELQNAYKAAMEDWIAAIKREEALAIVPHEVAEVAIRLYGFKSAVKICRGLDVAVSEDASNRFIVARLVSEPDRRGGMAKLMNGDRQAGGLFDPLRDLTAEGLGVLTSTGLAGE